VDKTHAQKTLATYFKPPLDQKESRRRRNHTCDFIEHYSITCYHESYASELPGVAAL